ncbi:hypothetical protein [Desulfuromonas soudanensis]|uniref:hypothetical protein n=1 Tax=Desulfuromonas soudanensis TaxID=1603606 RepID=UPI0006AD19E0|nr:hypothetical protein [Desulfuromonas soudanensis]
MALRVDEKTMEAVGTVTQLMSINAKPVDIGNAVRAAADGDVVAPALTMLESVESFAAIMGKTFKSAAGVLVVANLVNDARNIKKDFDETGYITDSTYLATASSIAAGLALVVAGAAVGTVAAPVALVVGTVASISLFPSGKS